MHRVDESHRNRGDREEAQWYNDKYRVFIDKPPTWNPKCNAYVYNFKGRVAQASIKNFQVVPFGQPRESTGEMRQEYVL